MKTKGATIRVVAPLTPSDRGHRGATSPGMGPCSSNSPLPSYRSMHDLLPLIRPDCLGQHRALGTLSLPCLESGTKLAHHPTYYAYSCALRAIFTRSASAASATRSVMCPRSF